MAADDVEVEEPHAERETRPTRTADSRAEVRRATGLRAFDRKTMGDSSESERSCG
jgi:hypothetical protein